MALVGYHVNALLGRVPSYVARADLVSAGALALVRAARGYDETTGVPFARYASLRIKGALIDELRGMDWVSRGARRRARQVTEVADQLTATLGRAPQRAELAAAMGVGVEEIDTARGDAEVRVLSIEGFDGSIADSVASTGISPEDSLLVNEKLAFLRAGVDSLPERLRYVVTELFFNDRPVTELAEELGVTQSRISQLRTEALGLLKDGMNASLDPDLVAPTARPDGVAERRRRAYFAEVAARAARSSQAAAAAAVPTQRGPGVVPAAVPMGRVRQYDLAAG
ncbi:MAG: sigma-70 family RNA polymerase sigma factor [Cellulomonadaceae bacterium]|nr:sigma-70 family RNA polymerase sigma factor [Cellulomonadaceae bacterium]